MINVKAMLTPQRVTALKRLSMPYSTPETALGLLDTGASCSAIDVLLAHRLGLEARGVTNIHTPSTGDAHVATNVYDVCYVIGEGSPKPLVTNLSVIECKLASEGFLVLIGRDVLDKCVFQYNGPTARYTLEF
jgi:hypothetical protein